MANFQHQSLSAGRWLTLSLAEQLGNIGSEVQRVAHSRGDEKRFNMSIIRALELFDLTIGDKRWKKRLKELARVREVFCNAAYNGKEYEVIFEDLERYFYYFIYSARLQRTI